MKNLAIECSGTAGSVGMSDEGTLLGFNELDAKVGSVQTLAPQIDQMIKRFGRPNLISVTNGPGSFTGLRVGLTMAKLLGFGWEIPIVAVNTLHAIALRAAQSLPNISTNLIVFPVINAFRGQVFATSVNIALPNHIRPSCDSICVDARHWCDDPYRTLEIEIPSQALFTGPGLANYLPRIGERPSTVEQIAPQAFWQPTAMEVDVLGRRSYSEGNWHDSVHLNPRYIRASAAEEKARS